MRAPPTSRATVSRSWEDDDATPIEALERQFLILGSPQRWVDRLGDMHDRLAPEWICIRIRTPRPETGYYPTAGESLECIQRLGEEVLRHFQHR